jgi:hypothetical protein
MIAYCGKSNNPPSGCTFYHSAWIICGPQLPQSTVADLCKSLFDASFTAELGFGSQNLCKIEHKCFR